MTVVLAPTPENVARAARALERGDVVGLPTETVYGLAARVFDEAALARVFAAKERPTFDPLIVHVLAPPPSACVASLAALGLVDAAALAPAARARVEALAARFWPGPLTLVLPKAPGVPDLATAGLATVGVRAPRHPVARALIELSGPLAAPSANRFGRISPTTAAAVVDELGGRVELVLDGGPCDVGVESTVVRVEPAGDLVLLRPGGVAVEDLARAAGAELRHGDAPRPPGEALASPGLVASHYAPRARVRLLPAPVASLDDEALREAASLAGGARRVGLLVLRGDAAAAGARLERALGVPVDARALSRDGDLAEAARTLFAGLRALDARCDPILAEAALEDRGLGFAILDRLRRAAAPRP